MKLKFALYLSLFYSAQVFADFDSVFPFETFNPIIKMQNQLLNTFMEASDGLTFEEAIGIKTCDTDCPEGFNIGKAYKTKIINKDIPFEKAEEKLAKRSGAVWYVMPAANGKYDTINLGTAFKAEDPQQIVMSLHQLTKKV